MKYIITNDISFDNSIIKYKYKLNYSFPFIEYVLNKIIDKYDNNDIIDIKDLSSSAFDNALELKIRNYIGKL